MTLTTWSALVTSTGELALLAAQPFLLHGELHVSRDAIDFVVFTGDAIDCYPAGNMPDLGPPGYLVPFWPQHLRGYPLFSLTTLLPFPQLRSIRHQDPRKRKLMVPDRVA